MTTLIFDHMEKNCWDIKRISAYSFGFKTATAPLGKAYEPSGVAISIDFGIPVGGFTLLIS
jgi:hypothetical protein